MKHLTIKALRVEKSLFNMFLLVFIYFLKQTNRLQKTSSLTFLLSYLEATLSTYYKKYRVNFETVNLLEMNEYSVQIL